MDDSLVTARPAAKPQQATRLTSTIVTANGIQTSATSADVRELLANGKFFWIDVAGGDEASRHDLLHELGLSDPDIAWITGFGKAGRLQIDRQRLRAVTWLALGTDGATEIHLLCSRACLLTVWTGEPTTLREIRTHFAERADKLMMNPYEAAAILLQLLLGTLHSAICEADEKFQALRTKLGEDPYSIDFTTLSARLHRLQSAWSDIDRYSSQVRTAIVGIEVLPGVDQRAAAELNDYADQVEDFERRLQERSRWASDILHDYATTIARRQSEQISRLTMVSLIFLPITFLTGFFGMNFNWMIQVLGGPVAFMTLGIALPVFSVLLTVSWLRRRGLM